MNDDQAVHEIAGYIHRRKTSRTLSVAMNGVDVVGKTTLADSLRDELERRGHRVIRASMDGFHNPVRTHYVRGEIHRHHERVQAEGRVDPGAIFYLQLAQRALTFQINNSSDGTDGLN
jgi:thymidylate kinase